MVTFLVCQKILPKPKVLRSIFSVSFSTSFIDFSLNSLFFKGSINNQFWLCWLLWAVCRASLKVERQGYLSWSGDCYGSSCCAAQALGCGALAVGAHGLRSCPQKALDWDPHLWCTGSCSVACGIFLGSKIELVFQHCKVIL